MDLLFNSSMAINRQKFQKAVNQLSKYHGIINQEDVASMLHLDNIEGKKIGSQTKTLTLPSQLDLELNRLLMDDYSGALTISELAKEIDNLLKSSSFNPNSPEEISIKNKLIEIFKDKVINDILNVPSGQENNVNVSIESPSKEKPNLSVVKVNSVRVSPEKRYADAATIFFNGIPTLEMSRATPYLEIEFLFPRSPLTDDNIVQTTSLPKFLYGAKKASPGSPLYSMVESLKVSATDLKNPNDSKIDYYSNVGMELFTSPQLLVNADDASNNRANPVLNKFAPFLTLKKLELSVAPSTGIMSFKSGQLSLVLHDRSRLNEIAEFLKPDLYGRTEISIEYGWVHPDGELIVGNENIYGDFINGLRVRERYGVINSSFTFEEGGAVNINLSIAMKGATDFELVNSSNDTNELSDHLKKLDDLQRTVEEYKNRLYKNVNDDKVKEIRGIQILDAAMDARNHLTLSKDLKNKLREFKNSLKQSNKPDTKELQTALEAMFQTTDKQKEKGVSVVEDVRTSLQNLVKNKIDRIIDSNDPFVILTEDKIKNKRTKRGKVNFLTNADKKSAFKSKFETKKTLNVPVSLAKLLLFFIGEPLVSTGKFDDIQFVFHTFNSHAGAMKDKNVAEFLIDMSYFSEQYYRLREASLSKSVNLSLKQFLNFLSDIILDDYANSSYGLVDQKGSLFKRKEDGSAEAINEVPIYQERMENALTEYGITDGIFKPGKVQFLIESYPERMGTKDGDDAFKKSAKNILKIHVIDQVNTSYETLNKLVSAQRDASLSVFNPGQSDKKPTDATPAETSKQIEATRLISAAESADFLEPIIDNNNPTNIKLYRIKGGQAALKKFLMQTMPYVIYGAAGTTIKTANVSSMQDPALSTVNLMRSYQKTELDPAGEHPGGLPMQVIPTQLSLQTFGMPLINFAQAFYMDFQTGTTVDNIYAVVGLTHTFEPGLFSSEIKMSPLDAYGTYIGLTNRLSEALTLLRDSANKNNS